VTEPASADLAARPFDELIAELQRIVQALEAGNLPLEESIELYRRGLELHAACEARLRDAELTISQLGRGLTEEPVEAGSANVDLAPEPGEGL
jgi:exodeoxyribonuclease VII small subunit